MLVGGSLTALMIAAMGVLHWSWGALGLLALIVALASIRSASSRGDLQIAHPSAIESNSEAVIYQSILAGLPDAAFILDGRSNIVAGNATARESFAMEIGRHISQVIRAPELLQSVELASWRDEPQRIILRLPPPREQSFVASVSPLAGPRAADRPSLLIVLRDSTEQEQVSRMRADFVANASHELRTPLASLKGFVETLQGAAKDDPQAREQFLGIMQQQASRMARLIEDLLTLSRIELREHVAPSAMVDLAAVIAETANILHPISEQSGIAIDVIATVQPALVIGDRDELIQVVQNLVQNAIKYGRKGGIVRISTKRNGQRMMLVVEDDGIGIAQHHLPRLTERFYRVSAKESRDRGGTGLGLAIVKHIVSRHRGELRIESELGKGSVFTVVLPAATQP